jgi:hypothetical protein
MFLAPSHRLRRLLKSPIKTRILGAEVQSDKTAGSQNGIPTESFWLEGANNLGM